MIHEWTGKKEGEGHWYYELYSIRSQGHFYTQTPLSLSLSLFLSLSVFLSLSLLVFLPTANPSLTCPCSLPPFQIPYLPVCPCTPPSLNLTLLRPSVSLSFSYSRRTEKILFCPFSIFFKRQEKESFEPFFLTLN